MSIFHYTVNLIEVKAETREKAIEWVEDILREMSGDGSVARYIKEGGEPNES